MTVDSAEENSQDQPMAEAQVRRFGALAPSDDHRPVWVDPDLDFIRTLTRHGGESLKRCMQCGTCSATCDLSPDTAPFPRKEMAWAVWGMKDRLLEDPDIWLCHQCNDCTVNCPRGARPGDVLGFVRQECVRQFAVPRFLGQWVRDPVYVPLLLAIPTTLLTLALALRQPIESVLGLTRDTGPRFVFSYSSAFPHWLLNTFFGLFSLLVLVAIVVSVLRFWRALSAAAARDGISTPAKGIVPSIFSTLGNVLTHQEFARCTATRPRLVSHRCVFFGFLALTLVTLWVITARVNPLIQGDFVYPFGFWNPWKLLANAGGVAVVAGCLLMVRDRLMSRDEFGEGNYEDWALLASLLLVAVTGFVTEALHYLRLEPHRHFAYFVHLVFVFTVLMYLPYSKLAHLFYRGTAMVFAEHIGRIRGAAPSLSRNGQDGAQGGKDHVGVTSATR